MGEGGISRQEFYYELEWWEIMRLYHGIQRRYRPLHDTSRTRDYMYLTAHWSEKNGPAPKSPYDWAPHAWDPVISKDWLQRQADEARELLRRAREETSESLETSNNQTAAEE